MKSYSMLKKIIPMFFGIFCKLLLFCKLIVCKLFLRINIKILLSRCVESGLVKVNDNKVDIDYRQGVGITGD